MRIRLIACLGLFAFPAFAQEVKATAHYDIALGSTHVATADIALDDIGGHYQMTGNARIAGLAQIVAGGVATMDSAGTSDARSLQSQKFDLSTKAEGNSSSVAITYASGQVTAFQVTPPIVNNINRVPIERKHLSDVNDMIAAFVLKGGALDQSLCDRKMQIFNGVERFNIALRYAKDDVATSKRTGYQGPVVVCYLGYTPISGHYTTSDLTNYLAKDDHILIWYAPLNAPGYFIPYRILVTTTAGDLSMVLTELDQ